MSADDWAYAPGSNLPGGYIKAIVRVGDTVRRPPEPNADFVHDLLRHLEASGFDGSPRFLGVDEQGREVLSYIEGHVAWDSEQPGGVWSDEALEEAARLTRRIHDLTRGTTLAGDCPVVCHNDLSPKNTVYRDLGHGYRPVAFIDWDGARPGEPEDDLARPLWQFLWLSGRQSDLDAFVRSMHAMLDAYGYRGERRLLLGHIERNMRDTISGIHERAAAGQSAYQRLVSMSAIGHIQADLDWLQEHRSAIEAGLGSSHG